MREYDQSKHRILREQSYVCWFCGRPIAEEQGHWHHGVIPRGHTNYRKYRYWLDMAENGAIVCPECDARHGRMTNFRIRNKLYSQKIDQGYDMEKWLESIPMKAKEKFHYVPREDRNA